MYKNLAIGFERSLFKSTMKQLLVDCIAFEYVKDNLFESASKRPIETVSR
jgi:hypothetical protein